MTQISPEQFREEALRFLTANARPRAETDWAWGQGPDHVGLFAERTPEEDRAEVEAARAWRRTVFDAGFGWITGPRRYGGRELPAEYEHLYQSLEAGFETPSGAPFGIGLGMVTPTILAHGGETVKEAYLRPLHRGDVIACQLFSEPGAGSDLAGLQTRAVRHGDEWVVTGQKVWTSGAQFSDIGEIICRTDPEAPKHRGLTGFLVDMHAAGVTVRPLRQMTGGASFNEVFFDGVRVPDDHRLGEVNQGWTVALTTLMHERAAIGLGVTAVRTGATSTRRLAELLRWLGKQDDPVLRQELADIYVHGAVARATNLRAMAKVKAGQVPGPELSIAKLALTQNLQRISDFVAHALGPRLAADTGEWGTYAWTEFVLGVPGIRLAGGTDEVLRNVIGERVLGLPKEPRLDR